MSGQALLPVVDALAAIRDHRIDPPVETVPLDDALGRQLAAPVRAMVTQPPLAVSAMDGYAVRHADVAAGDARLTLIGASPAGRPFGGAMGAGEAVRVFTGGAIPKGADHVVIQEHAVADGDVITVSAPEDGPAHIRPAGLDFAEGDVLVEAGEWLAAASLTAIAAGNHAHVPVYRQPRVAILANGDELREPGTTLAAGEIIASSRFGLAALIRQWGGIPLDMGIAPDDPAAIADRSEAARDADLIVPIGGASVGDHDHMQAAFAGLGYTPVFSKVAVKPGKPTWFSKRGDQCVLGLPGNPASSLVCAHLFLRPLITGLGPPAIRAKLSQAIGRNGRRETYLRAQVTVDRSAGLSIAPAANQDSSLIHPFLHANALIRRVPDAEGLDAGAVCDALLIGEICTAP